MIYLLLAAGLFMGWSLGTNDAANAFGTAVATRVVNGEEDIIVITKLGVVIRTSLTQVAKTGRNTQGVKIIKISDKECVKSIASLEPEQEENVEQVQETNEE